VLLRRDAAGGWAHHRQDEAHWQGAHRRRRVELELARLDRHTKNLIAFLKDNPVDAEALSPIRMELSDIHEKRRRLVYVARCELLPLEAMLGHKPETPAKDDGRCPRVVARAGFEPTTFGL